MENLDYDKYVKNLDVREALYLLKNKVEKENEKDDPQNNFDINKNNLEENKQEENSEKLLEDLKSSNLPPIDVKSLIHDKDWNERKEDSEIIKKKVADKILKLDKVKKIFIKLILFRI